MKPAEPHTVHLDPHGFVERIRWPDGPVCPYCGERERLAADRLSGEVRYECPSCERHRGTIRRPGSGDVPEDATPRRDIVPRFV